MALADMTQEEIDARNWKQCKHVADQLELIADGYLYVDDDGEKHDASDLDEVPEDWEQVTMCDYFADVYNVRFVLDGDLDYIAVRLMVACGGPNVWVDTETGSVELYWWGDRANYPLTSSTVAEIDAFASEWLDIRRS